MLDELWDCKTLRTDNQTDIISTQPEKNLKKEIIFWKKENLLMSEVCLVKKFLWPCDFDPGSTVSALYCVEQLNGRFQRGPKQND